MSIDEEFTKLIPDKGWLHEYVQYSRRNVMAPDSFHLACGLAALSAVAGNALYWPIGRRRYYGTFWGVLCGPAGTAKKSSAIGIATELAEELITDIRIASDFSREGMLRAISEHLTGYIELDEFGGFLRKAGRDYNAGLTQDLSWMWDSRLGFKRQLSRETLEFKDGFGQRARPRLTILGGCPLDDFTSYVRFGDLKQGFISRLLFFVMPHGDSVPYVDPDHEEHHAWDSLVSGLKELVGLRSAEREVGFDQDEREHWREYDRKAASEAATAPPELAGWESRRGVWIAKLAILFSIARTYAPVIDHEELARAEWLVDILTRTMRAIVDEVPLEGDRDSERRRKARGKARTMARTSGLVIERDLYRALQNDFSKVRDLRDIMEFSVVAGECVRGLGPREEGARGRRPAAYWFPEISRVMPEGFSVPVERDQEEEVS